jgi:S-adenosylmethionine decarboxylase
MTSFLVAHSAGYDLDTSLTDVSSVSCASPPNDAKMPVKGDAAPCEADSGEAGVPTAPNMDHFVNKDGEYYAGTHLIIDLWEASRLDDLDHVRQTLIQAVTAAKATLLHIHLHHFSENGGISGVAVLAESHISIHSWPEIGYAALDVFMCGDSDPEETIPVLRKAFSPGRVDVNDVRRGRVQEETVDSGKLRTGAAA